MAALRIFLAVILLLAAGAGAGLAQAPGAAQGARATTEPFISTPNVELGELFRDDDWGFEFRMPKGMQPLDPVSMEDLRRRNRPHADDMESADGVVARIQFYQFIVPESQANILLRAFEPPYIVESASSLRQKTAEREVQMGLPNQSRGKLHRFRFRGGRIGLLTSRDFGELPRGDLTLRQTTGYLRGNTRSYVVQYTAPIAEFAAHEEQFLACLASFVINEGKAVTALDIAPPKESPGFLSLPVLGSLGLLAGLIVVLLAVMRKRS